MKINTKVRYGLRAMIEINANGYSSGILQREISATQEIPLTYLDSIITGLRNAGLIVNYSGKRSGYILSRSPAEISVYDIYLAFEPELSLVDCSNPAIECKRVHLCPARDLWFELSDQLKSRMKSSTLDQFTIRN